MHPPRLVFALLLAVLSAAPPVVARPAEEAGSIAVATARGIVFADDDGDGARDADERGIAGVALSNGKDVVRSGPDGGYAIPLAAGQTLFVVKPAGWQVPRGGNGLPKFWVHHQPGPGPALRFGGIRPTGPLPAAIDFPLLPEMPSSPDRLEVLVFADPQPKQATDVDYYRRDIVAPLRGQTAARLGVSLGDIVADDLSLYPAMNAATASLGVPWLHVPGNHDLDFDAPGDAASLGSFRQAYGPDTFAWETRQAVFIGFDDVIYQRGRTPAYVGGLREDQFAFLEAYLPGVPKDRLLVLAMHIPLFDAEGMETFRHADRARLFALLQAFPHVLVLSGHTHMQQHRYHGAAEGWHGARPLHEYNVGAACGAYWSGVKDAAGIPDSTMSDGTPNGYASLAIGGDGQYALAWHPARDPGDTQIGLHAPQVLRQGAYPAWGVYANVYMGQADTRVEFRVDDSDWQPMVHVLAPDPGLQAENMRDDLAGHLRGYDRSPEATPSPHLWRAALPTTLAVGSHRIEVRAYLDGGGEARAAVGYRLEAASP